MSEKTKDIYSVIRCICTSSMPEGLPESTLYGCIKLLTMDEKTRNCLLESSGFSDGIESQMAKAAEIIEEKNIDVNLVKSAMKLLVGTIARLGEKTDYAIKVAEYGTETTVDQIIADAITNIPPEELAIFENGKKLNDVMDYQKSLKEKIPPKAKEEEKTESDSKEIIEESSDKKAKKEKKEKRISSKIYSPVMKSYLENLKGMIPVFVEMEQTESLWSQTLLISVDSGCGFTTFLKELAGLFIDAQISRDASPTDLVEEIILNQKQQQSGGDKYDSWRMLENTVKACASDDKKLKAVLGLDISAWLSEIDTQEVKDHLRKIVELNKSALLVFRIPFMEYRSVVKTEGVIRDVMSTERVVIPPASIEELNNFLMDMVEKKGFSFTEDCKSIIEQGIVEEKNDNHFYGFRTIEKMFTSIVYEKAKYNFANKKKDKDIDATQLQEFLKLSHRAKTSEELLANMVGVDEIVKEIDSKIKQIKLVQMQAENGKSIERPSIHMMFTGNPGTGKTTIARIVAMKLRDAGILSKGNCFEIKGRDLCGRYVGETTPKTCAKCRDAYGSVLFIDEAYELYVGRKENADSDFGHEAIAALIAEMENHRDDMCVIMAGYSDDMEHMLSANAGFESRVPIRIEFPNYTREQMTQIFFSMLEGRFTYEDELKQAVDKYFQELDSEVIESKTFSNARFVRNLYERTWGEAVLRYDLEDADDIIIKVSDFNSAAGKINPKNTEEPPRRTLGFGEIY